MKFSAQEDLKLPQAEVFARLSNFETFERIAIKRNVRVSQISQNNPNEDTLGWNCRFKVRGRQRDVEIRLIEFDEPKQHEVSCGKPCIACATGNRSHSTVSSANTHTSCLRARAQNAACTLIGSIHEACTIKV